ncbi:MAG: formylglycine-generating enzyme family protein [Rudaea sp.]
MLRSLPIALALLASPAFAADYRLIAGGRFASALPGDDKAADVIVAPFLLRTTPVTNAEFQRFVIAHSQWQRDRVAPVFAEPQYLARWSMATALGEALRPNQPVTQVSWFSARAFCAGEGARLPSWNEWEFAAAADATRSDARGDPAWRERILSWYSRPATSDLPSVGGAPNLYGVRDLHGLVWEWVDDFNALLVASDSRDQNDPDRLKFCGAGALSIRDLDNYAVLMRIAMMSSLKAANTTISVGFRCARTEPGAKP